MRELPSAGLKFLSVASNLIYVVIVPVLAFFFLKDGDLIRSHMLEMLDTGPLRGVVESVMSDIHLLLAHYMRALVLLSLSTFTAYAIAFTIMGVPFGVLLAVVAMALEFIPMIGPLTAVAIILLVTLISGAHFWAVVIFLVAWRMFTDYFLSVRLMGQGVQLHPLLVLLGVFGGAEVAGVAGSFLSVPALAMARILYVRTRRSRLSVPAETPADAIDPMRRALWLALLAWPLPAHVMSMSSGDLAISGARAHYELRMPLYEVAHVPNPERTLLEHIRFAGARLVQSECHADARARHLPLRRGLRIRRAGGPRGRGVYLPRHHRAQPRAPAPRHARRETR
jgi:hypothetical protein